MWNATDVLCFLVFLLVCGSYSCVRVLVPPEFEQPRFIEQAEFDRECNYADLYEDRGCV
jgi:hypothetical protein